MGGRFFLLAISILFTLLSQWYINHRTYPVENVLIVHKYHYSNDSIHLVDEEKYAQYQMSNVNLLTLNIHDLFLSSHTLTSNKKERRRSANLFRPTTGRVVLHELCPKTYKNDTTTYLNEQFGSSRCSTSNKVTLVTRNINNTEVLLEPPLSNRTNLLETKYATELSLLDKIKDEVLLEKSTFIHNRTARKEHALKMKLFNHTVYSVEEDIQNNTIHFYPWNDGLNYNQICSKLLYHLTNQTGPILINSSLHGGLGHRFYSLFDAIVFALLLKRPLYLDIADVLIDNLNTCLRSLQYRGNLSSIPHCEKAQCVSDLNDYHTIISTPIVISDVRVPHCLLYSQENLDIINDYNITGFPVTWIQFRQIVYRLMTNPLEETVQVIQQQKQLLGPMENILGIHIRCAGLLADQKERTAMVKERELIQLPSYILRMAQLIKQPGQNVTIFLSTDSSIAEQFMRTVLADYRIVVYNPYRRGHTTGGRANYLTIQQAEVDLYLLSQTKAFMFTGCSGFSTACYALNSIPYTYRMNVMKTVSVK